MQNLEYFFINHNLQVKISPKPRVSFIIMKKESKLPVLG